MLGQNGTGSVQRADESQQHHRRGTTGSEANSNSNNNERDVEKKQLLGDYKNGVADGVTYSDMSMVSTEDAHSPLNSNEPDAVAAPPGMVLFGHSFKTSHTAILGSLTIITGGILLGTLLPPHGGSEKNPKPWDTISAIIGWWYFTAWAVSFFPQIYLNWVRKCVVGQSFDYLFLNVLGFSCYSVYTVSFYSVESVKEEYKERFGHSNTVDTNDVCFAVYALAGCIFNSWQVWAYDRGPQTTSKYTVALIVLSVVFLGGWALIIYVFDVRKKNVFNTLDLLYGVSFVKLIVTLVKYLPQIYLNFTRKLTVGWNIWNVLLDFTGGSLSVVQQLLDCGTQGAWNGIAGNLIKFLLGSLSVVYDIIFMIQHFWLYRNNNKILEREKRAKKEAAAAAAL